MEDYPRNLAEFEARFATEQACREYLCQLRWPEGFRCPRCGHDKAWAVRTALLECAGCGHQASPTAGTIFQDTRQPLQSWFRAMWWLTSQKNGASALGLQRVLGLGSYKTAWTWLHKLRRAMVRPGRDRLSGRVEVDETYLGGLEEGVRGRQTDAKALIVVAAEEDGAGIGRVRIRTIPNASGRFGRPPRTASQQTGYSFLRRTRRCFPRISGSYARRDDLTTWPGVPDRLHPAHGAGAPHVPGELHERGPDPSAQSCAKRPAAVSPIWCNMVNTRKSPADERE